MKLKQIIDEIKYYGNVNKHLKKVKYVHVMYNDKFNKSFVDFLNRNFDINEHLILCERLNQKFPFPEAANVFEIRKLKKVNLKYKNIKKIIFHSLFIPDAVPYLYKNQDILKEKAYWIIWGGDLYNAQRDEINDFVRSNFKEYVGKCDESVCRERYNTILEDKTFFDTAYIFPITKNMLDNATKQQNDFVRIQINNSCDDSTLEMLDVLSKYKNENIKVTTILSYGKMEYKEQIIQKGKEIFGDKFEYVEDYMSPQEYSEHLAQNDILILNQNRQQGVGNTMASLYLGSKVYIRSDVTTYSSFNSSGTKIFDSKIISDIDFQIFKLYEEKDSNKKSIEWFFNETHVANQWSEVFNY